MEKPISLDRLSKDSIEHIILRPGPIWELSRERKPTPHELVIAVYKQGVKDIRDIAILGGVTVQKANEILAAHKRDDRRL